MEPEINLNFLTDHFDAKIGMGYNLLTPPTGHRLFLENEPFKGFYFIESGAVKLTTEFTKDLRKNTTGKFLHDISPPNFYLGLDGNKFYSYTATVCKSTSVRFYPFSHQDMIPYEVLRDALFQNSVLDKCRMRMTKKLFLSPVREKMAAVLYELARVFGTFDSEGTLISVPLIRTEMAQLVGTIDESVSRHLNEFKSDGLVKIYHKRIVITDMEKLSKIVGV